MDKLPGRQGVEWIGLDWIRQRLFVACFFRVEILIVDEQCIIAKGGATVGRRNGLLEKQTQYYYGNSK